MAGRLLFQERDRGYSTVVQHKRMETVAEFVSQIYYYHTGSCTVLLRYLAQVSLQK